MLRGGKVAVARGLWQRSRMTGAYGARRGGAAEAIRLRMLAAVTAGCGLTVACGGNAADGGPLPQSVDSSGIPATEFIVASTGGTEQNSEQGLDQVSAQEDNSDGEISIENPSPDGMLLGASASAQSQTKFFNWQGDPYSCTSSFAVEYEYCVHPERVSEISQLAESFGKTPGFSPDGCPDAVTLLSGGPGNCSLAATDSVLKGSTVRDSECCFYLCGDVPGCGRPLRVDGQPLIAASISRADWVRELPSVFQEQRVAACWRQELGEQWLEDALFEHASIAAFASFTLSLLQFGAPCSLIAASTRACTQETRHAQDCFSLASHYLGRGIGPSLLNSRNAVGDTDLETLVLETFVDGCVGESSAALWAHAQGQQLESTFPHPILTRIAEDETQHAQLAWSFVAWAIHKEGGALANTLVPLLEEKFRKLVVEQQRRVQQAPCWSKAKARSFLAGGRLAPVEKERIALQNLLEVVGPALSQLVSQSTPRCLSQDLRS